MHSRMIIISIVALITSVILRVLFGFHKIIPDDILTRILFHMINGMTFTLIGMYCSMKSEYTLVMKHNVRDILSLCVSCVMGVVGILPFAVLFKCLSDWPIIDCIIMLIILRRSFNNTVDITIKMVYPDDTNDRWIDL